MLGTETTDICSLPPCGDAVKREPTTRPDHDVWFRPARRALRETPETLRTNFQPDTANFLFSMAVFSPTFQERENLTKIVTLGDYLAARHTLDARGMLQFVREGGQSGYSARELKDIRAAVSWTRWIDALNDGRRWPIQRLFERLDPMLGEGIAITVAPSHDPFRTETPLRELAQRLAAVQGRHDATGCLVRHTKIQRITYGGPSFPHLHTATVHVVEEERFFGAPVLLLDDIARTGSTLRACRTLLLDSGAASVQMLALGRVWRG